MIRKLQKRFVLTAMTAVTVLLLVLLGVINLVNAWTVRQQSERLLSMLCENEIAPLPEKPRQDRERRGFLEPLVTEDAKMAAIYFTVHLDETGEPVWADISHIASVSEQEAKELAEQFSLTEIREGKSGHFKYRVVQAADKKGWTVIFLDTSAQTSAVLRVLLLSALAGIACWLLMLLFVALLSKRAIRPVAANMEKQKQFVTDAGHEIKTPLAIIMANTEALELYNGESKWSKNIREQVVRLNGLMQNLLTLARLDEETAATKKEKVSFSKLTEDTLRVFAEPAERKKLAIRTEIESEIHLVADREQLVWLLSILLDNAIKYSPEGGSVEVSLKRRDAVQLLIKNDCEVLPDCASEKLFDRFYRADSARTQKNGGYGIGLSAAETIVQHHKGRIKAEYKDNSKFVIRVEL